MKKILFMLAAVMTFAMSSCSNDDIPVSEPTTFKINPQNVISGFSQWEMNPGDLTVLPTWAKLRITLLIYNTSGQLVAQDQQFFSDYSHIMSTDLALSSGETYLAVAITDVIRPGGNDDGSDFCYWDFTGKDKLTTLTLTDTGYIGSQKNILGIGTEYFTVGDMNSQVQMNVEPAGSLYIVYYMGIHRWSDVTEYQLALNREADYVTFNTSGDQDYNIETSSNLDWRISLLDDLDDYNADNIYNYVFSLPFGNTRFQFQARVDDGRLLDIANNMTINVKKGHTYFVYIDLEELESDYADFDDARSRSILTEMGYGSISARCKNISKYNLIK